jgi:hypothetical protein
MSRKIKIGEGPEEIEIGNYRPINKNSLRGSFAMCLYPSGQKILDCLYFVTEERSWFNFPSKQQKNGEYIPLISYINKEYRALLNDAVITLLKEVEQNSEKSQADPFGKNTLQSKSSSSGPDLPF